MTATYDLATDIGKIRLLIADTAIATAHFTDEELQIFLDLNSASINLAAAAALEAWGSSLAESADSERIGDYSYTKKQVAHKLELAQRLRDNEANEPALDWAEMDLVSLPESIEESE